MLKVGLTGGIGSGKTTVSDLFTKLNPSKDLLTVIDTDIIARKIVEINHPAYTAIVKQFGNAILNSDMSLNRPSLRKLIFNNTKARKLLESITHPAIQAEVNHTLSMLNVRYCIIVIPLLFETQSNYHLDRVLVVDSSSNEQITRTTKRDAVTADDVQDILDAQVTRKYRLKHADDVITNSGDLGQLKSQVEKLHLFYLNLK